MVPRVRFHHLCERFGIPAPENVSGNSLLVTLVFQIHPNEKDFNKLVKIHILNQ